ncbi:MAG: sigma-70 family RNA polymerase sigma factor [Eubacteriales bacterium]
MYTQQNDYPVAKSMEQVRLDFDINTLINKHKTQLYNLCFKLTLDRNDADDLFQETWIKVSRYIHKADNEHFKQWLFRICINQYKDNYRKEKRRKDVFYDYFDSNESKEYVLENTNYSLSAEEEYQNKREYERIIERINNLPEKLKIPMVLFYFQQMKYEEMARILGVPEGTIKSRLNAAKKRLRKELNGETK